MHWHALEQPSKGKRRALHGSEVTQTHTVPPTGNSRCCSVHRIGLGIRTSTALHTVVPSTDRVVACSFFHLSREETEIGFRNGHIQHSLANLSFTFLLRTSPDQVPPSPLHTRLNLLEADHNHTLLVPRHQTHLLLASRVKSIQCTQHMRQI